MDLAGDHEEYALAAFDVDVAATSPVAQLDAWLADAAAAGVAEPNAMTVATATPAGRPSARVVLLRGLDDRGLVFYTNYRSRKGQELAANPWAAVVFHWQALERQVRAEGRVERTGEAESTAYFAGRPRGSRLGAWASPQSEVVGDRAALERALAEADATYPDEVPRPPHWGGFRVRPVQFEFWQGRPNRLHDRVRYRLDGTPGQTWLRERLAP